MLVAIFVKVEGVCRFIKNFLARLGLKPQANSSSQLKLTKEKFLDFCESFIAVITIANIFYIVIKAQGRQQAIEAIARLNIDLLESDRYLVGSSLT